MINTIKLKLNFKIVITGGSGRFGTVLQKKYKSNNIYIAGYFWATVDFDPGAGISILTSQGLEDCFIAKYDSVGSFIFAKSISGASHSLPKRIFVNQQENI